LLGTKGRESDEGGVAIGTCKHSYGADGFRHLVDRFPAAFLTMILPWIHADDRNYEQREMAMALFLTP